MTALDIFTYSGQQVRTVTVDGEPWFVAADVTDLLGYANGRDALTRIPDRMKNTVALNDGIRGNPNRAILNEAGVNRLIMRSTLPEAERVQDWIAEDVIPAIRRTGSYSKPVTLAERSLALIGDLTEEVTRQAAQIEEQAPLVAQALTYNDSRTLTTRAAFAREIIKWALGEGYAVKQPEVLAFLAAKLGLFVRGARADNGEATLDAERRGLATTIKGTSDNGHKYATGKLTSEGVAYAWARITRHINETGSLDLTPRAVAS